MTDRPTPALPFHPAVAAWFRATFAAPTEVQLAAWDAIGSGRHALIAAPTGSGKTLAAFMVAIDRLVRDGLAGELRDETTVVYVSPLKALSNDIHINLELPLAGIRAELARRGLPELEIRSQVRTGDTPQGERAAMKKRAPQILVTTPESLYILLGSESGRSMLRSTRSVIVDEIHALAPNKRGSHLALSLARLEALCERPLLRIGLSATQQPIDEVARFLVGRPNVEADGTPRCRIVDVGHQRARDLQLVVPPAPLAPVMSNEVWESVYEQLAGLARAHRTTLVFVNTRRMAERAARHLSDRLGRDAVAAHHGSLARELRLDAEQRLKSGALRVLVATASLELGIDIGDVELVCQLGSPHSISAFLQRVGRSGHAIGGLPKGRLFPQSRDDLVECAALLDAVRRGELDRLQLVRNPLDVLAQQIVAEVGAGEIGEDALYARMTAAWPFATLPRDTFTAVVRMLADGFTTRRGPRAAYLHRDAVHGVLRPRRNARLTSITSGGAIPDIADYQVVLEPASIVIGTINEDFAVESLAGDVFQLGNASYRILRIEQGRVRVEDARGMPPNLPFWLGEAPGRSDALSAAVARLREEIERRLPAGEASANAALLWLTDTVGLDDAAARQLVDYLMAARAALTALPTLDTIVIERFFDESGGMQLVVHSPYGSRVNRAWGLALRKRFCRSFNFELQAAATEDAIILSLSTSHSFPLADVTRFLHSNTVRDVLIQALLDAPMFGVRWRWNASISLALPRYSGGRKTPPQLQRMRAEDLLATVFPDQVACLENIVGEREIPDHPLVAQTLHDCLSEAMDIDRLVELLRQAEAGAIRFVCRDLAAPSPLAAEILNARPYAFLDDAPLEERRTQAVQNRRLLDPQQAAEFGRLDAAAIASVRDEAWPTPRDVDEMHATLMEIGYITDDEAQRDPRWHDWLHQLASSRRATRVTGTSRFSGDREAIPAGAVEAERQTAVAAEAAAPAGDSLWTAAERLPQLQALHPDATLAPPITAPAEYAVGWDVDHALVELLRARLAALGPVTVAALAASLAMANSEIERGLLALESEGYAMRGRYDDAVEAEQWCERHLLARIHRYTLGRLRREIEPVEPRDFVRFLLQWQHVAPGAQVSGPEALAGVLSQLEGYEAPAAAWEAELLPARVAGYEISWLDELCQAGRIGWSRLRAPAAEHSAGPVRATPIVLSPRRALPGWSAVAALGQRSTPARIGSRAQKVVDALREHGASFFDELLESARLIETELEAALAELVAAGLVQADSFIGLRALLVPAGKRSSRHGRGGRRRLSPFGIENAGRWSLLRRPTFDDPGPRRGPLRASAEQLEPVVRTLLRRYGVIGAPLLQREAPWLPPWRELVRVCHRLEARGELRGGRFVSRLSGEQFALPEAVALLRRVRQQPADGTLVSVAAVDPLNLVGSIVAGGRIPALLGHRLLYRDGVPIASLGGGTFTPLAELGPAEREAARRALQPLATPSQRPGLPHSDAIAATAGLDGNRPPFR